jgi:hypothetical protein
MSETDDYDCHGAVVDAAESEEEWLHGSLIKRANQECELAGRERLEAPMGVGDGESKGRRGDDGVSGP